jgi:DNA polymerase-3 subunit alpha
MAQVDIRGDIAYYPCGCQFKVFDRGEPIRLHFDPTIEKLPLACPRTWELLGEGNTKGVFQLETRFGQQYAKKLQPENMEQLAALTAIMRPGCIQAIRDGKNVADHYIDRKNGVEEVEYVHPALEPILSESYGEMIYQEQAMKIATDLAGFTLQQADILRKAIGKKKADIMAQVKGDFLDGCRKVGIVDVETAEDLFGWIEKSQRYSFNKSHAVSYAYNAYLSAYAKAHFKHSFFTSYLFFAKDKQKKFDEVKLLINNARVMGIDVRPPDFRHTNPHFKHIEDKIYFGFGDIKSVGDSSINKMDTAIYQMETGLGKHRRDWCWAEFLVYFSQKVSSTTIAGMIEAGALDYFGVFRQQMMFEYEQFSKLTVKEQTWCGQNVDIAGDRVHKLQDILEIMVMWYDLSPELQADVPKPCANKNRVAKVKDMLELVKNPPYSLEDTPDWIARVEEAKLGVSLTASVLDSCKDVSQANCTCLDFLKRQELNDGIFIAAFIEEVKEHTTRNNDAMAFVTLSDNEATLDSVIFPGEWNAIRQSGLCVPENTVMVSGDRSNKGTFVIKRMWQLS